jgi:hypothetical protein
VLRQQVSSITINSSVCPKSNLSSLAAVIMSYTAPLNAPLPAEAMQRFIETEDITCLEKPLLFERNDRQFKKLQCCQAAAVTLMTCGMTLPFMPVASLCPTTYADQFSLKLDKDALTFQAANNDCCW